MFYKYYIFACLFFSGYCYSQTDSLQVHLSPNIQNYTKSLDPLAPSKAAFYSAVLPGLGQYYNKSYWKIPVVYGGMATSLYFYIDNSKIYNRARNEYKLRLRGVEKTDNPKVGSYTQAQLISVQKSAQRNKDLSLFITIGIYVLNIIDANVDAHLQQFNVDEDLSFKPTFEYNPVLNQNHLNINVSYRF